MAEVFIPKRTSGIENKVLYSRESEGQAPSKTNKKLAAFTLAEVLITLAIIGVVAALTIPVVVQNYQKQQFYTKFMKAFNTMSNAFQSAQAEHGSCWGWGTYYANSPELNNEIYEKNLFPFLRIQKICSSASDCGIPNDLVVKGLNSSEERSYTDYYFEFDDGYSINPIILTDGTIVHVVLGSDAGRDLGDIVVDTNGIKGPNTLGRDVFIIPSDRKDGMCVVGKSDYFTTDERIEEYCSMSQESDGDSCSLKLIKEGKMDY